MSKKELIAIDVIEKFRRGELSRKEASLKLKKSERTVTRKARAVREKGIEDRPLAIA